MKVRMVAFLGALTLLLGLTASFVTPTGAAPKQKPEKTITSKAVSGKMRGGSDPNIKNAHEVNHKGDKTPAPPSKGGTKARGGVGTIHVDNTTRYYIKVYANGDYIGTVGPYGDLYRSAEEGHFRLYATARFDDGSYKTWGPRGADVSDDETTRWSLGY